MKSLVWRVNDGKLRQNMKTILAIIASIFLTATLFFNQESKQHGRIQRRPIHAEELLRTCSARLVIPGPPEDFKSRTESDRFEPGTPVTYIKNATIWIGRSEGTYQYADILLDK